MVQPEVIIRPVGLLERYHLTRHFLGLDACVLSAAQYKSSEGLSLGKATLFRALRKVVETHGALGVRLSGESTSRPSFARLSEINLSDVVEFSDSDDLAVVIEAQLPRPFDTNANLPLWRVVVLKETTVCFTWHHCIGDGKSGLAFQRSLLSFLQDDVGNSNALDTPENDVVVIPATLTLSPGIETVTNLAPSWRKVLQELYDLFAPTSWTRGASAWSGNVVSTHPTLKTHAKLINFSPEDVSTFITLCRANQSTLTSAFQTLAISVLSTIIPTDNFSTISAYIPISLRSVAGTSQDVFCNHVSTLHTYPPIDATFSWIVASELASVLRTGVLKSREEVGMIKFLFGRYTAFFEDKLGKKRPGGLELSNVGRFNNGQARPGATWSIGKMAFAQCDAVVGAALKLNVVGNPLGGVTIAVTWGDGAIADSVAELFVSQFESGFNKLITEVK